MRNEMYSRLNEEHAATKHAALRRIETAICFVAANAASAFTKCLLCAVSAALILRHGILRPKNFKAKFHSEMKFYRANSACTCKFKPVPIPKF
nr:hypothetical protein [uncultured Campylobacter sp.]